MTTAIIILFVVGILVKVSQVIKNVAKSFLYTVLSLLGLVLLFKWVVKPLYKFLLWCAQKIWIGLNWLGNKMRLHYSYRNDDLFWLNVANSRDRLAFIEEVPVSRQLTSHWPFKNKGATFATPTFFSLQYPNQSLYLSLYSSLPISQGHYQSPSLLTSP